MVMVSSSRALSIFYFVYIKISKKHEVFCYLVSLVLCVLLYVYINL